MPLAFEGRPFARCRERHRIKAGLPVDAARLSNWAGQEGMGRIMERLMGKS